MPVSLGWASFCRAIRPGKFRLVVCFELVVACCVLAMATAGQEKSAAPTDGSARTQNGPANQAAARTVPDALRFANGLLRQKKYELAAEEYERFVKSSVPGKERDDAHFGLANARLYQGQFQESKQAFDDFLKSAPTDSRRLTARYRVGELAFLLGDLVTARRSLEEFSAATKDHPGLEMGLTYLGDTCFTLRDYQPARAAYERALAMFPRGRLVDRARFGLGRTLAALEEREAALTVMRELTAPSRPEWVDRAWLQIALIQKGGGHYQEALDALDTLERVAPRSPQLSEARLQRALVLVRMGRPAEAEPVLKSLASDATSASAAFATLELATIELERNDAPGARRTLESALKRFPKSPLVPAMQFRIAEALQKQNLLNEAQARFEQMAAAFPDDPWADDALQRAAQIALDRGDSLAARRLAGEFATRFGKSSLRLDVRLIEALRPGS